MVIKLMGDNGNTKLFANHGYSLQNGKESPPCKHFSIRGYVATMRQKDLKICSLFPVNVSDSQPLLPPLVVPVFSSWSCNKCRGETELNVIDNTDERELCTGNQETQKYNNVPAPEEVNIHNFIDLTGDTDDDDESDCIPINNALEVACRDRMKDHDPSLENNLSQVSNAQAIEVYPSLIQEMQANQRGFEGNAASNMELDTSNLKTEGKRCSKVSNKRKHKYEGIQCLEELRKSCKLTRKNIDMVTENDVMKHHPKKRNYRTSKRHKKMRLLEEIFRKDDEPNLQLIRQEGETNTLGEPRVSSTSAISGNGALIHVNDDDEARSAQNMEQAIIKCDNGVSKEVSLVENEVAETLLGMSLIVSNMENEIEETQNKQSKARDFDLNIPYFDDTTDQEMLNRYNIDLAVELVDSNQRISIDLNSAPLTGANDPILINTILNPGEPSNPNLNIDYSCTHNFSPAESQGPIIFGRKLTVVPMIGTSERFCWMNKNPAEFTTVEAGNLYMVDIQDKAKKRTWEKTHGPSSMQRKKSKKY